MTTWARISLCVRAASTWYGWPTSGCLASGWRCCGRSTQPGLTGGPTYPDLADPYYSGDFATTFADIDTALPGLHRWVDETLAYATVGTWLRPPR